MVVGVVVVVIVVVVVVVVVGTVEVDVATAAVAAWSEIDEMTLFRNAIVDACVWTVAFREEIRARMSTPLTRTRRSAPEMRNKFPASSIVTAPSSLLPDPEAEHRGAAVATSRIKNSEGRK